MPFIPHTEADVAAMLASIGAPSTDALFDEIPADLNCGGLPGIPEGLSEMQITTSDGQRGSAIYELTGQWHHRYFPIGRGEKLPPLGVTPSELHS